MNFEDIVAQMKPLLEQLKSNGPYRAPTYEGLPKKGIYVFYEGETPMYVGRVGRQTIRERIGQHTRPSSGPETATFAFLLLQKKLGIKTGHEAKSTRAERAKEHEAAFKEMKERVCNMEVRAVTVEDSVIQTIFEVYTALALDTPYNSFEAH